MNKKQLRVVEKYNLKNMNLLVLELRWENAQ